jgi:RNA polymerase sigma factor (TIGR02999 family)
MLRAGMLPLAIRVRHAGGAAVLGAGPKARCDRALAGTEAGRSRIEQDPTMNDANAPLDQPLADPAASALAADVLFARVYDRLKAMAGRALGRDPATLDATALVHELYLRLSASDRLLFAHPAQFLTYAARAMRHLLQNRARDRLRQRAGGDWVRVTLTASDQRFALESAEQALAMDAALDRLAAADPRAAQVVELLYFAGVTLEQASDALGCSRSTIDRDWRFARAFLKAELD